MKALRIFWLILLLTSSNLCSAKSLLQSAVKALGLSGRILWVDATANLETLSKADNLGQLVARARKAHINGIILDVKPIAGLVLYPSQIAPRLKEWGGKPFPQDFDPVEEMVKTCREAGIPLYLSVNVFSEGHKLYKKGPAYQKKEWQVITYEIERYLQVGSDTYPIAKIEEAPHADELAIFTSSSAPLSPGNLYALFSEDGKVVHLLEGKYLSGKQLIPPRKGGILIANGRAKEWLLHHLRSKRFITLKGQPVFRRAEDNTTDPYALFVNPLLPEVQEYELSLLKEVVTRYPVSGIVLDRMRYPNLHSDFSEVSRRAFEEWLGRRVTYWPTEILQFSPYPGDPVLRGPLFKKWLEFRAWTIRHFLERVVKQLRALRPNLKIGVYVGSWYNTYYNVGVNWGNPENIPHYEWMTETYPQTGYAPLLDFICTGTYYPIPWKEEAQEQELSPSLTVEGAGEESVEVVKDATFTYGSVYVLQYTGNPQAFQEAIKASLKATQGVMIFDASYLDRYGWWSYLEEVLTEEGPAPHEIPGLLYHLKRAGQLVRERKEPEEAKAPRFKPRFAPETYPDL